MAKLSDIDKVLEHLEQSVMFEKLLHKVKKVICVESKQSDLPNTPQLVNHVIEDIARKTQVETQIIYQDRIVEKKIEIPVEKIVEQKIEITPQWAIDLEEQYNYLKQLSHFPELLSILVQNNKDQKNALLSFISCSSQWQNIVRIWDKLAEYCKSNHQEIDPDQFKFLENALFLYNLTLSNSRAELRSPKINDDFDFANHTQVAGLGNSISQILLPALYSASGEKVKSALVITG